MMAVTWWLAETVLRMRSRERAAAFICSSSLETTKFVAPIFMAASFFFGLVEMAVTVLPIAAAKRIPIW